MRRSWVLKEARSPKYRPKVIKDKKKEAKKRGILESSNIRNLI